MEFFKQTIARFGDLGGTPDILKGVTGVNVDGGVEQYEYRGDEDLHNLANISADPAASFSSSDLKGILDLTSLNMVELDSTHKLELNWRKMIHGGTFAPGGTDVQAVFIGGAMYPTSLSCSHGQPCSIAVNVIGASDDGSNPPVTIDADKTATTEIIQDRAYTLAGMKFGTTGSKTISLESVNIEFGLDVQAKGSNGTYYKTYVVQMGRNTIIKLSTFDLSQVALYDLNGIDDKTNDLIIYFARLKEGGSRYADNSGEHISITVKAHNMMTKSIGDMAEIEIRPFSKITDPLFTFDIGVNIT
ncbi:MAG: hypothetical protein COA79_20995 [Planctomycetota bacterium]|nr:MAG: hypothetical protein COA79_20995 [Planctomycetota bacterium]